jgi:hypothetical protein
MAHMKKLLVLFFFTLSLTAHAQQLPEAPSAATPNRFFDREAKISFTVLASSIAIDSAVTQHLWQQHHIAEANPIARPFVQRGWAGQVAGDAIGMGLTIGGVYLLHRTNHHKMEKWLTRIVVSAEAFNAGRQVYGWAGH